MWDDATTSSTHLDPVHHAVKVDPALTLATTIEVPLNVATTESGPRDRQNEPSNSLLLLTPTKNNSAVSLFVATTAPLIRTPTAVRTGGKTKVTGPVFKEMFRNLPLSTSETSKLEGDEPPLMDRVSKRSENCCCGNTRADSNVPEDMMSLYFLLLY